MIVDDIQSCLMSLKPPRPGADRCIMLGMSANRALTAWAYHYNDYDVPEQLFGFDVVKVNHFEGWAVADINLAGKWSYHNWVILAPLDVSSEKNSDTPKFLSCQTSSL